MLDTMTTIRRINIIAGISGSPLLPQASKSIQSPEAISNKQKSFLRPIGGSFRSNDTYPFQSEASTFCNTIKTMVTVEDMTGDCSFLFNNTFGQFQGSAR